MKKYCVTSRSVVNLSKFSGHLKHASSNNMIRVSSFSYVNHNNEHNVGAPPPRSPPKVNLSVDDHRDDINHPFKTNKTRDNNMMEDVTTDDYNYPLNTNKPRDDDDTMEDVTEKAKRGTKGVVETAFNAGAAVAEGMEKSWGGIKETTEKIKDSVLGNDNDDDNNEKRYRDNYRGDHRGNVDENIEDLRRKAGGYDRRSP